jgi:hypothetical protein
MSYNSNPYAFRSVPQSVRNELASRSGKNGILWAAKRFPWIHITSLASPCNPQYETLSSLKNGSLYEKNKIRPLPTISDVSVKKLSDNGTTRRATIKLVAYTDNQLIELQKCYFIPGMGCRVEWGWNESATGNKTLGPIKGGGKSDWSAIANCLINSQAAQDTAYSGFQGVVGNFSYSLTADNYWDCTLEVIGATEAFASTKITEGGCECPTTQKNEQDKGEPITKNEPPLFSNLLSLYKNFDETYPKLKGLVQPYFSKYETESGETITPPSTVTQLQYLGNERDEHGRDSTGFWNMITSMVTTTETSEPYISWSVLEALINATCTAVVGSEKGVFGSIKSSNVKLPHHDSVASGVWLMSADPRICIIPGVRGQISKYYGPGLSNNGIAAYAKGDDPSDASALDRETMTINLGDILVNVVFILEQFSSVKNGDGQLITFINGVLEGINKACGHPWEFMVVSSADKSSKCLTPNQEPTHPTISVMETKKPQDNNAIDVYTIPALPFGSAQNGPSSVIRELKLETKLPEAMKTMALYSHGPKQSTSTPGGGGCGHVVFTPFRLGGAVINKGIPHKTREEEAAFAKATAAITRVANIFTNITQTQVEQSLLGINCDDVCIKTKDTPKEVTPFKDLVKKLYDSVDTSTIDAVQNALEKEYGKAANTSTNNLCEGVSLPFMFEYTVDGIGGFKFGQLVSCDRIPANIRDGFNWQIFSVEHTITANDWTTNITTKPRYKQVKK